MATIPSLRATSEDMLHLDLLRFVASVGIVLHHSIEYFLPHSERLHLQTYDLALFVDLFFVISGFVVAYVYSEKVSTTAGVGRFMQRRIGRLVPLHWLTLLIAFVLWSASVDARLPAHHPPDLSPLCVADTAFLLHAFVPCGNHTYLNGVTWSISAEMAMYAVFPLIAVLVRARRYMLIPLTLFFFAIAFARSPGGIYLHLPPLERAAPAFLLGVTFFCYRAEISRLRIPYLAMPTAVILLAGSMLAGVQEFAIVPMVLAVCFLAVHFDTKRVVPHIVQTFAPLGQLTYSIYLWHPLLVFVLMNLVGDKLLHDRYELPIAVLTYALIAATSYLSYVLYETPARRWVDHLGRPIASARMRASNKRPGGICRESARWWPSHVRQDR